MFKDFTKYEVYPNGKIWSYKTNRFLKTATNKQGYQQVSLIDNKGKRKTYRVNRVVYESVTGSPIPECMQVNHINEDKTDNRFANLNLLTPKENVNWGTCIKRRAKTHSKENKNGKLSKQVGAFKNDELVFAFPSTRECGRQGFNQGAVAACCRGEKITYKGFTWRYI